jgi:hypothetical protein
LITVKSLVNLSCIPTNAPTWRFEEDANSKGYFDTIDHNEERLGEFRLSCISANAATGLFEEVSDHAEWQSDEGTPQGAVLSPLLARSMC